MGSKTAYLEQALLEHALGLSTFTAPATVHFLASTAAFDATLTGSTVIEPSGFSYARVSATNDGSTWDVVAGSDPTTTSNITQIDFPTASGSWGTILSIYVADASSAGNVLWGTDVAGAGIPIVNLSTLSIPIGGFVIRET